MYSHNISQNSSLQTSLPIFPLPIFILPYGRQRLRIFEAKYLTMMTQSLDGRGFIIAQPNWDKTTEKKIPVKPWGTLVNVVDFNQGEDGVLLIDVEGCQLLNLQGFHYQDNGLLLGEYQQRKHWSTHKNTSPCMPNLILITALKELFSQYQDLNRLYPTPKFDSVQWVNARLLEILPVPIKVKSLFIQSDSLFSLDKFLVSIFQENDLKSEPYV